MRIAHFLNKNLKHPELQRQLIFQNGQKGQKGQAMTEYIVLLAILVSVVLTVFKGWLGPTLNKLSAKVTSNLETQFLKTDLHYYPLGR
jgi:Flp pilus assembly pilin Flp